MKRTQVYFDEGDWARLQARASRSGVSAASVVRDAVTEYLGKDPAHKDPLLDMVEEARATPERPGGPTDGALNHDHHLYGWPKVGEPWPETND
jgi:hypothetical protein